MLRGVSRVSNACVQLRTLRKMLGISQQELADIAGFTKQGYSQMEMGRSTARPERMAPINKYLRHEREKHIEALEREIENLKSFDIDETLYLK